jgi:hypothetical protein
MVQVQEEEQKRESHQSGGFFCEKLKYIPPELSLSKIKNETSI